ASTPIDAEKPLLKDSDGEDVDVHTYRLKKAQEKDKIRSKPDKNRKRGEAGKSLK
nr:hypothetical protein [Tanacetum cinerariifolium]